MRLSWAPSSPRRIPEFPAGDPSRRLLDHARLRTDRSQSKTDNLDCIWVSGFARFCSSKLRPRERRTSFVDRSDPLLPPYFPSRSTPSPFLQHLPPIPSAPPSPS